MQRPLGCILCGWSLSLLVREAPVWAQLVVQALDRWHCTAACVGIGRDRGSVTKLGGFVSVLHVGALHMFLHRRAATAVTHAQGSCCMQPAQAGQEVGVGVLSWLSEACADN